MSEAARAGGRRMGTGDGRVIGLVAAAHFVSHMMQMALPPLLPVLHDAFAVSYTQLGLVLASFYVASGFGQTVAGLLVDRHGADRLLLGGLALVSGGIALAGLVPSFWLLVPLAVVAGLGNSVFHPADLSILSHKVSDRMRGRAFAVHGVAGQLGFAASPILVAAISALAGWRLALLGTGAVGLIVTAILFANRDALIFARTAGAPAPDRAGRRSGFAGVVSSPLILMAFAYFVLTSFGGNGIQSFSITAFSSAYGLALATATLCLTVYLVGSSTGMVIGGFLADRTHDHARLAMTGILTSAGLIAVLAFLPGNPLTILPTMAVAGLAFGVTGPSRDILIREAAAGVRVGSVFGFVYSGLDLGSLASPLLFGPLTDHQMPRAVFVAAAIAFALAGPTVMQVGRRGRRAGIAAAPEAAE